MNGSNPNGRTRGIIAPNLPQTKCVLAPSASPLPRPSPQYVFSEMVGMARCATAIEIRFSSSEHDLAYPSLEVIRTGRGKLPPRHLPATPHAHRVVTQPFRQFVEHLLQRRLAGQQFNQAALERVQTHWRNYVASTDAKRASPAWFVQQFGASETPQGSRPRVSAKAPMTKMVAELDASGRQRPRSRTRSGAR